MSSKSDAVLNQAYTFIESGTLDQAKALLETALMADLDNKVLVFAVQCCAFWLDVFSVAAQADHFNRGEILTGEWSRFRTFYENSKDNSERVVYAFRKGVYSVALDQYSRASDENDTSLKAQILRKQGLCYKKLGSYENALDLLTESNQLVQNSAAILAEMADCYALCGESKIAKVLFREAFFMNAQDVQLDNLESQLITVLVDHLISLSQDGDDDVSGAKEKLNGGSGRNSERNHTARGTQNSQQPGLRKGMTMQQMKEWIPVYGVLMGIFSVKRELRSREVGKLKQDIYAKENELKNPANDATILTPKLLNMYFWLIDYYVLSKESVTKINEVLLKIKILDAEVYRLYVK